MASASQAVTAARVTRSITGRNGLIDKYFYFAMSLLTAAIVVYGFSHTVNAFLIHAEVPRPRILWVHATVFSGWVLFFILQTALVRTHHVSWHRTLGWFGAGLGTLMVPLGITTAVVMGRFDTHRLHDAGAALFRIVPFCDMLAFATFFALAVYWRRKPELHRRLIFIATCVLLSAAFGRMPFFGNHLIFYAGVDAVILLGVLRDLLVNRSVHKVYRVALPLLVVLQGFVMYTLLRAPEWWVKTAHAIVG
jgi:hypothetical protein